MMLYILLILLALACAALLAQLYAVRAALRQAEAAAQQQAEAARRAEAALAQLHGQVWDAANTIHLYACLSEEEAPMQSLQHKQAAIRRAAEQLLGGKQERMRP